MRRTIILRSDDHHLYGDAPYDEVYEVSDGVYNVVKAMLDEMVLRHASIFPLPVSFGSHRRPPTERNEQGGGYGEAPRRPI